MPYFDTCSYKLHETEEHLIVECASQTLGSLSRKGLRSRTHRDQLSLNIWYQLRKIFQKYTKMFFRLFSNAFSTASMEHVACMGKMRNVYKILVRKPDHSEDLDTDGMIILEWILWKQDEVWNGCIWLSIETNG
jgi:hypothetical protein